MVALRMKLAAIRELPREHRQAEPTWVWAYRIPGGFEFATPGGQRLRVFENQLELALHKASAELLAA